MRKMSDSQAKYINRKNDILSLFKNSLSAFKYKLITDYISSDYRVQIDGLITTEEGYPYCVIEIKTSLQEIPEIAKTRVLANINNIKARFAVITDGKDYLFIDNSKKYADFKSINYNQVIQFNLNNVSLF